MGARAAHGQDNPSYPPRQPVRDELVPWDVPFPDYSPEAWTHGDVLANDRELSTGHKWADPPDVARAGLAQRVTVRRGPCAMRHRASTQGERT